MTRVHFGLTALFTIILAGCESLPVDLPGRGGGSSTPATPAPAAATQEDPANGIAGASLCIASAFYLADAGVMDEAQAENGAEVWTSILDVIPATEDERQDGVDSAYAMLRGLDARGGEAGLSTAIDQYSEGGSCIDQQFQRNFIARFGDPDLMSRQLQGGQ